MDFFVTGLPRSKTAWMSLYLTRDRFRCYHELLAQAGVKQCMKFEHAVETVVGNSDSGLLLYYQQFVEQFPTSPWIHIIRDEDEVMESSIKFGIPKPNIEFAIYCRNQLRADMNGDPNYLEIPFNFTDLDLEKVCEIIGMQYHQNYTDYMRSYNIQMSEYQKRKLLQHAGLDSM